ncbi:calvin cycle protein CP12-2, chloroplastic-like [Cicer arietinum]|uniref:Calvin cycle protein CP12-2, chloroplastic-like n=1 Tax=Cicer arietinum TaxID=3827 RepID=A0A1S2XZ19_CICAR|nr:calvin cycle protein CP12-2, chloroplastic-like [Cicer arietinum]
MAATMAGVTLSSPRVLFKGPESLQKSHAIRFGPVFMLSQRRTGSVSSGRILTIRPVRAAPDSISEKVEESIKNAEEACSGDATSGECVAAWDEVEELSAAASHARDKKKESDPLDEYCKDNPESDECRTYDN